mgnify:FL=1
MKTTTMGILRFFWLVLSSLFITSVFAQKKEAQEVKDEWNLTTSKTFYGVSVYADIAGPITSMFKDGKTDFSFGVDADICHTIYPTFEAGYSKYDATESYNYGLPQIPGYSYTCNGSYYKIGANFNFFNDGRGNKVIPLLYIGAKFAFSPSHFDIENVRLSNEFWNIEKAYSVSGKSLCRWAEFSVGLRYPIAKFFCMGVEGKLREFGRAKVKTVDMPDGSSFDVKQSYSPGYGNFNGSKWGVKYTIGYFFH